VTDNEGFDLGATVDDEAFRRGVDERARRVEEASRERRRRLGLRSEREREDAAVTLEHFEELQNDDTWATLNRRFVDVASEGRMPTFFPPPSFERRPTSKENDDLGPDADATEPPPMKGLLHGRVGGRLQLPKSDDDDDATHVVTIPRGLAVIDGQLHVLYDCKLRLPLYWADTHRRDADGDLVLKTIGVEQWRGKSRLRDPLADPAVFQRIVARCSSGTLATCYAASVGERKTKGKIKKTALAPHDGHDDDDDDDAEKHDEANPEQPPADPLQPATLKADLHPILLAPDSSDEDE